MSITRDHFFRPSTISSTGVGLVSNSCAGCMFHTMTGVRGRFSSFRSCETLNPAQALYSIVVAKEANSLPCCVVTDPKGPNNDCRVSDQQNTSRTSGSSGNHLHRLLFQCFPPRLPCRTSPARCCRTSSGRSRSNGCTARTGPDSI